jgi:hypothetical protein
VLPTLAQDTNLRVTLGGAAAEDRDFVHAVYGNFPYVLLFVVLLTYVLLARAFRSLILPLKAVILNLVSLGAAFGIVVFIFQLGHGSQAIWNVAATQSIIPWIPLMIFAFLYGLSMDYEVFMLTRIREEFDRVGDTPEAIRLGLARKARDERGARPLPRVLRPLVEPGYGHQAIRDRAVGRDPLRRDGDPGAARPVADAAPRALELVVPTTCSEGAPCGARAARAGRRLDLFGGDERGFVDPFVGESGPFLRGLHCVFRLAFEQTEALLLGRDERRAEVADRRSFGRQLTRSLLRGACSARQLLLGEARQ